MIPFPRELIEAARRHLVPLAIYTQVLFRPGEREAVFQCRECGWNIHRRDCGAVIPYQITWEAARTMALHGQSKHRWPCEGFV